MAFKPIAGQEYYLISKYSGKALGFDNDAKAAQLKQFDFDAANRHQKFRFDAGKDFHWILSPPFKSYYMAVHDNWQADNAPVIQWLWAPDQTNNRFRFEPAGDGYYRIRIMHSNKFLHAASKDNKAAVVQYGLADGDHQLFKPVPVIDQPVEKSPKTFAEMNNMGREVALGLMGLIPEVGGGLKAMVGFFWAGDNKMADLWEQMKSYVDDRIRTYMDAAQLKNLREMLAGELKVLEQISQRKEKQGDDIFSMVDRIVTKEPHFLGQRKEVLPYLVGLGTLMIALRHKLHTMDKDQFTKTHDWDAIKTNLENSIREYSEAVEKNRKDIMDDRMKLIPDRQDGRDDSPYGSTLWSVIKDNYDGWTMKFTWGTRSKMGSEDYKELAEHALQQRRNQVRLQYESELDEFLRLAKFWKYFKPGEPPYKDTLKERKIGAFGGYYSNTLFTPESKKKITKIITHVHGRDILCGIEIFYDGTSAGLKGKTGTRSETLELKDGEYIANVFGYYDRSVYGVWFTTQKGKISGGGSPAGGTYFQASLADSFNARLTGISGSYKDATMDNLSFHWEYMD
ncbi:RICIN domain-containing protein [Chitinophagaceae bacterium MMS25-I14]